MASEEEMSSAETPEDVPLTPAYPDRSPLDTNNKSTNNTSNTSNNNTSSGSNNNRFSPDLLARMQHVSYLFFEMLYCLVVKGFNTSMSSTTSFSILRKGCEISTHTSGVIQKIPGAEATKILSSLCYENTVVYRASFALTMFYFIHFLSVSDLTCCIDGETRMKIQTHFAVMKGVLLFLLNCASYLLPNEFFASYAWVCMMASSIFLLIQIILMIDWSHYWNDEWGRRAERNIKWQYYLVLVTLVSYSCGLVGTGINIYFFVPQETCNLNGIVITLTLIAAIAYTIVAIWVPHGSIVPCSIVFAYTVGLEFTSLRNTDDTQCNRLAGSPPGMKVVLLSAFVSSVCLAWSAVSVGSTQRGVSLDEPEDDPDENGHLGAYCYFYIIMMMGSMYLAMLVTDWQVSGSVRSDGHPQGTTVAFWVKMGTVSSTIGLFFWTLLAPYFCCKHRDFGFDTTWDE